MTPITPSLHYILFAAVQDNLCQSALVAQIPLATLYCVYCTSLYSNVVYCTVLHCNVLYCTDLNTLLHGGHVDEAEGGGVAQLGPVLLALHLALLHLNIFALCVKYFWVCIKLYLPGL